MLKLNNDKIKLSDDIRCKLERFVNKTNKVNKFRGKKYNNVEIIYTVLKDIINNNSITKLDELKGLDKSKISNWKVIISEKEINDYPRKDNYRLSLKRDSNLINDDDVIKIGNESYYFCVSNTKDDIKSFIEQVEKMFPDYKGMIKRLY